VSVGRTAAGDDGLVVACVERDYRKGNKKGNKGSLSIDINLRSKTCFESPDMPSNVDTMCITYRPLADEADDNDIYKVQLNRRGGAKGTLYY